MVTRSDPVSVQAGTLTKVVTLQSSSLSAKDTTPFMNFRAALFNDIHVFFIQDH